MTVRLILPDAWSSVVSAVGGGPLLVKGRQAGLRHRARTSTRPLSTDPAARAAVGQLADGRVILVAVDGGRPGYSVGMTNYELAQDDGELSARSPRRGSSTAGSSRPRSTAQVLNRLEPGSGRCRSRRRCSSSTRACTRRPRRSRCVGKGSAAAGEQPRVPDHAPLDRDRDRRRPRRGGAPGRRRQRVSRAPTASPGTTFDAEGTWHWNVQATDDQNRASTADRTFAYDLTLSGLCGAADRRTAAAGLQVGFTLSRPASVTLRIAAANGTLVATLPPSQPAGRRPVAHAGTGSPRPAPGRRPARTSRA